MTKKAGFSMIEVIVVVGILSIVASIFIMNLRPFSVDAENVAFKVTALFKQTRAKAMSTTSAYRVSLLGTLLIIESANNCGATSWVKDNRLGFDLDDNVSITATSGAWPVCFTSRGTATSSLQLTISDERGKNAISEVLLGGAARVVQ